MLWHRHHSDPKLSWAHLKLSVTLQGSYLKCSLFHVIFILHVYTMYHTVYLCKDVSVRMAVQLRARPWVQSLKSPGQSVIITPKDTVILQCRSAQVCSVLKVRVFKILG